MNSDAQSLLVTLLGAAALRLSFTDVYLRYVKEGLRPFLVIAGVLLVAIGVVSLWRDAVAGRQDHDRHDHDRESHDHAHGPAVAWLLVLPIMAIFLVAPPALGSYAAGRGSSTVGKPETGFSALPSGEAVPLTLTNYAGRAVWDPESLSGRTVRLRGFVAPRAGGGYYLARMTIACCAADSAPVKVAVRGADVSFPADTWIEITGRYTSGIERTGSDVVPRIEAISVRKIPAPRQPYE